MSRPRQANVAIHGRGEQRPVGVLRAPAHAAVPLRPLGAQRYESHPEGGPAGRPSRRHVRVLREALDLDSHGWPAEDGATPPATSVPKESADA